MFHRRMLLYMLMPMPVQVMFANMPEPDMAMAMPAMGATHVMLAVALCMRMFLMFIRTGLSGFSGGLFLGLRASCWRSSIRFLRRIRLLSCIWFVLRGGFGDIAGLGLSIGLDWSGPLLFGGIPVAGDIVERY
ncbi:MAG: hypothetical protein ACLQKK_02840 [Rhodomicrobium sp.]